LVNGKIHFRIDPCNEVNVVKQFGKEMLKEQIEFIYVLSSAIPMMSWGFGNINVSLFFITSSISGSCFARIKYCNQGKQKQLYTFDFSLIGIGTILFIVSVIIIIF
jgi:hypothetical protein